MAARDPLAPLLLPGAAALAGGLWLLRAASVGGSPPGAATLAGVAAGGLLVPLVVLAALRLVPPRPRAALTGLLDRLVPLAAPAAALVLSLAAAAFVSDAARQTLARAAPIAVPIWAGLLILRALPARWQPASRPLALVADVAVCLALAVVVFDSGLRVDFVHSNPYLGCVNDFLAGKTLLVDMNCQYGVGLIAGLAQVFRPGLLPITLPAFAAVNAALLVLQFAAVYVLLRVTVRSVVVSIAGLVLVLLVSFFGLTTLWRPTMASYPSWGPLRFGPAYLYLLVVVLEDALGRRYPPLRALKYVLLGVASVWSLEVFLYVAVVHLGVAGYGAVLAASGPRRLLGELLRLAGWSALAVLVSHLLLQAHIVARAGQLGDWRLYVQYFDRSLFENETLYAYRIDPWTPWAIVQSVYLVGVTWFGLKLLAAPRAAASTWDKVVLGMTLYGIVQFPYYVGRSDLHNLSIVSLPAPFVAVALTWGAAGTRPWADRSWTRWTWPAPERTGAWLRRGALYAVTVAAVAMVLLAEQNARAILQVGGAQANLALLGRIWRGEGAEVAAQLARRVEGTGQPEYREYEAAERLILAHSADRPRVGVMLSPAGTTEVLARLRKANAFPFTNLDNDSQAPITWQRLAEGRLPAGVQAGDVIYVQYDRLVTLELLVLRDVCQKFHLEPLGATGDGVVALRLEPRQAGRTNWSRCQQLAPVAHELIARFSPGAARVWVISDINTLIPLTHALGPAGPSLDVYAGGTDLGRLVRETVLARDLIRGEVFYGAFRPPVAANVWVLRQLCLYFGVEALGSSADGMTAYRLSGTPGLDGTNGPCAELATPIVRDDAGAIWLRDEHGSRHLFPDWITYRRYGGDPDPARLPVLSAAELAALPQGERVPSVLAGPRFVRGPEPTVYLLDGWTRYRIPDRATFERLGGRPDDADVWTLSAAELARLPEAPWDAAVGEAAWHALEREPAALAEVEAARSGAGVNLALQRPAAQSGGSNPGAAVDGDTGGDGSRSAIAQAAPGADAWWQVDLGEARPIGTVQVWPRTDACCLDRLQDFLVIVSDDDPGPIPVRDAVARPGAFSYFVIGRAAGPTTIPVHRSGRYVRVQVAFPSYLDVAEVQVWSDAP